ncbi:MAG: hypothetical protein ACRCWW_08630 [Scandinavium sp.]|uniref:hypothetical protein n=1 Tax=Scandinavium sp. TaxID=2830653 RepID=UPI003F2AEB36
MTPLFSPGCLYVTPGIHALIRRGMKLMPFLQRHTLGDWGNIGTEQKVANHHAIRHGKHIRSAYLVTPCTTLLIETLSGSTTLKLSDELTDRRLRYRHLGS